jgi:glyoxylase-like metal-dependent hydrolase (beta-lactamase superfamily II)
METRRLFMGSMNGILGPGMPYNGYLIFHPQGVVMVDTAFGAVFGDGPVGEFEYRASERLSWVGRSTLAGLADHNLVASDVRFIINTHLGDHSGENYLFKHATFFLQRPEVEHVRQEAPERRVKPWDFPGARIELLEGEDAEVLPGITCVFTPGHTPGHQSVLVAGNGRRQLIVGDAVYTAEIWEHPETMNEQHVAWPNQGKNPGWKGSAEKLKNLDADVIHFAHDTRILTAR